jgi:hypothetical protein
VDTTARLAGFGLLLVALVGLGYLLGTLVGIPG